jgi:hypothetical protein
MISAGIGASRVGHYHYMSLNPTKHVEKTIAALRNWSENKDKK